tara:strand:+ start:751 stop:987 length:237 start_codon:yes stop_codon:yes gene_type:complete
VLQNTLPEANLLIEVRRILRDCPPKTYVSKCQERVLAEVLLTEQRATQARQTTPWRSHDNVDFCGMQEIAGYGPTSSD